MSEPKLHHYVPAFYLRQFADEQERLRVRARSGRTWVSSVRTAAVETGLYSLPADGGKPASNSAERTLGRAESAAAHALHAIVDSGSVPKSGSPERQALAIFLGLQVGRTPEAQERHGFARNVLAWTGSDRVSHDQMREYLRDVHLGFDPGEPEVQGAFDVVNFEAERGLATTENHHAQIFNLGVQIHAPRFEAMRWSIERCRKPRFATCDRVPAVWRKETPRDSFEGVGFETAEEVWFPLDRSRLLVLRSDGPEEVRSVEPKRTKFVNAHLARHCFNYVFHHPALRADEAEFAMSSRRPSVRFNTGPGFQPGPLGKESLGEVLHVWVPIRDG